MENSSSKSFSFKTKTKQKTTRTMDFEVDNDSGDDTSSKKQTPRNVPTPSNEKKFSGNFILNNAFSKSHVDILDKSPGRTIKKLTSGYKESLEKSPVHMSSIKDKQAQLLKESKMSDYIKGNREGASKEFNHNLEEKVIASLI